MRPRRAVAPLGALGTIVVFVVVWLVAASPGADGAATITPGSYTITVVGGSGNLHLQKMGLSPGCSNGTDDDLDGTIDSVGGTGSDGKPKPADAQCASATDNDEGPTTTAYVPPSFKVDITADGTISAPAKDIVWQPTPTKQNGGPLGIVDAAITFKSDDLAGKAFTGHVDAATGKIEATWRWHLETTAKLPIVGSITIYIGNAMAPLTTTLSTEVTGGARFDPSTLAVTMANDSMVVPAATCGGNGLACATAVLEANKQLGLPASTGQSEMKVMAVVDRNPISAGTQASPDLSITKSHGGDFVMHEPGSYTIAVSNIGSGPTTGLVTVTERPPAGLEVTEMSGDGWTCVALSCAHPGPVPAGATLSEITATAVAATGGTFANTASVQTAGDAAPTNDTTTDITMVTVPPAGPTSQDLHLTKVHTGNFVVGSPGQYVLTVRNVGGSAASGPVTVTDTLPVGFEAATGAGVGWECTTIIGSVSCVHAGPVGAGATLGTLVVTATPTAAGDVVNTAVLSPISGDANPDNDSASDPTTVAPEPTELTPDLSLDKTHVGNGFTTGTPGTWKLAVTNHGTGPTTAPIELTDTLPDGVTVDSASGDGWVCTTAAPTVNCELAVPLAAGGTAAAVDVVVRATAAGSLTNSAAVTTDGDANVLDNGDQDVVAVADAPTGVPDLDVAVAPDGDLVAGQNSTVVVKVNNVGNAATTERINAVLTMPVGLTFVESSGDGWACAKNASGLGCAHAAALAAGDSAADLKVVVNPSATGANVVSAIVTTAGDTNAANNSEMVALQVKATADTTDDDDSTQDQDGSNDGNDSGSGLPVTGAETARLFALAAMLLLAGAALLVGVHEVTRSGTSELQ